MANQRAEGKTLVGCHVEEAFLNEIDDARGGMSRSDFLRKALYAYLTEKLGKTIPSELQFAPDRAGKGGRPRKSPLKALPSDVKRTSA
jgi:hypothetical protein